jgi:NAD(P)-dependent dehydrogenase (short-subunit alcohol dehydrogenase family)
VGEHSTAVLITGCSSGIGRAAAERLVAKGLPVYATARRAETLGDLEALGCTALALDVGDDDSMRAAVERVEADHGAVGALVNNAGYGEYGAVESVPMDRARAQLETTVVGPMRLAQLVLPAMRAQEQGRIVNIGSMGGRLTFPGGGWYHATKYALEALSDAMRFEVAPFGVQVVLVQPGLIRTGFDAAAVDVLRDSDGDGPYGALHAAVDAQMHEAYNGTMGRLGGGPDDVATVIVKAVTARRPKPRYKVTASARVLMGTRRWTTDRIWDAILRRQFAPSRATSSG